jgi:chromosome segregation protein
MEEKGNIFFYGSCWLRVDFHLHTKADREFDYHGDQAFYHSRYVDRLKENEINVGVIANHNKFDFEEFRILRKNAAKKEIYLLPGIELSINDGANGIHTLVIFSEEWIANGKDYINQFLNVAFSGKVAAEYEKENGRCNYNIMGIIAKLDEYNKDYFIVFAHVEDRCGLWNEIDGGRFVELGQKVEFKNRVLGFQKVRTNDKPGGKGRKQIQSWLTDYPAEIEGSDCKTVDEIGKGEPCYLKIGDYSYSAIKFALLDYHNRLSKTKPDYSHSYIKSVTYTGGVLDGKTIHFSPELNTLIGIRGSGKSSVVETIRYALDIPFGSQAEDRVYKNDLTRYALGSGGKISVQVMDRRGKQYEISRINNEGILVSASGNILPEINVRDTVINKPIYFGQKDLSASGAGFEKDLVEKLLGDKLKDIRAEIAMQAEKLQGLFIKLKKLADLEDDLKEIEKNKQDAEFKLKFYEDQGFGEKLNRQISYDKDSKKCSSLINSVKGYLEDLHEFINHHEDDLYNQLVFTPQYNQEFFEQLFAEYRQLLSYFEQIKIIYNNCKDKLAIIEEEVGRFDKKRDSLKEDFARIERQLSEQIREKGLKALKPEEFRDLHIIVNQSHEQINAISKKEKIRKGLKEEINKELDILNELWEREYRIISEETDKINKNESPLIINSAFKGEEAEFLKTMKDIFKGSKIRDLTFKKLTERFSDFISIYRNWNEARSIIGNMATVFENYFYENNFILLTYRVPDRFEIKYKDKELKHHSLGQRASALILFVLSRRENDLFIIDQPEDDLDNQTIYEDVIKLIRKIKPNTQFVLATHNANFPVLGDAEQIISCSYSDEVIDIKTGSIDRQEMQQEVVDIMEGGEEAFTERKRRYEEWKPKN